MEAFFRELGHEKRMAFVVVTHLNPDRASKLHEVIAHQTEMPVVVAEDGMTVRAGHVYVMREGTTLTIEDGRLHLHVDSPTERERRPIDVFFGSLANERRENAIGIVLSGGDSDGTLGVKAIKERNGVTFAQISDGDGPKNPEMPQSAISSGLIDFALPSNEMPAKLNMLFENSSARDDLIQQAEENNLKSAQREIADLLRSHSGHNFSGYKGKTFLRRIARRMQVVHDKTVEAYIERLRQEPEEVMTLFRDLLINVTGFFRDAEAFAALEKIVIPKLFEGRGADETIRIWVPGCSTGEEVYSIAILLWKT